MKNYLDLMKFYTGKEQIWDFSSTRHGSRNINTRIETLDSTCMWNQRIEIWLWFGDMQEIKKVDSVHREGIYIVGREAVMFRVYGPYPH